jgi:hypothetical protein
MFQDKTAKRFLLKLPGFGRNFNRSGEEGEEGEEVPVQSPVFSSFFAFFAAAVNFFFKSMLLLREF